MVNDYKKIIEGINIELEVFNSPKSVLARVKVDLVIPPMIIQGYTIRKNEKLDKLYVSPPSYLTKYKKYVSIIWSPSDFWKILERKIIDKYKESTGESDTSDEIDISDIDLSNEALY